MRTIAAIGLVIGILAFLAEIATPEFRCWFKLDICTTPLPQASETSIPPPEKLIEAPIQSLPTPIETILPTEKVSLASKVDTPPTPFKTPLLEFQGDTINFAAIFEPKQDMFETTKQFQVRSQQLLNQFNQIMRQRNLQYQAGTVELKNYNADNQTFFVNLHWQAKWIKQFLGDLPKTGTVNLPTHAAKAIYQAGEQKPLFITVHKVKNSLKSEGLLVEQGKTWKVNLLPLPQMVTIPAGRFKMGDIQRGGNKDEKPVHWVSIKSFAMSRYEITFNEYYAFAEATGRNKPNDNNWGRNHHPVINVSWHDAIAYAQWLSQQTGQNYRLPTEAEWEYAARAGTNTKYGLHNDNKIGKNRANCDGCGSRWDNKQTAPVGSFQPNQFGLYDMIGNVWEWVADKYHKNYNRAPEDGSVWENGEEYRVLRGGSWNSVPNLCRAAFRFRNFPEYQNFIVGIRIVLVAPTH
jgi:formylglycine-generating enzyme required for sulfatase activity